MTQEIELDIWNEFKQELDKKISFQDTKVVFPKNINHKEFWDTFLTKQLPEGSINRTLEKNFAIYIIQNKLDIEQIKQKYLAQGWKPNALLGWIKKVNEGSIVEYNTAELLKWCNEYSTELSPLLENKKYSHDTEFKLIWEKDLKNIQEQNTEWLIERLIPPKAVGVWTGKRGSFKTFLTLSAVFCASRGLNFLGKYPCKQSRVLYLDKENGTAIIKERVSLIKRGLGVEEQDFDIAFICFSQLKIDNYEDMKLIEKVIADNNINLLVVDTYRRAISFDENSAGDVSFLFVDTLRPLVEKYNLSIVLIHHDRKGSGQGDEMDEIRGSSDLANYCDFILKNERKGKKIILKQLKCRNAPEIEPIEISYETDETSFIKFNCLGNYEPQTSEDKAVETLMVWISQKGITHFKTKEAQEIAFNKGIKKQNFFSALNSMQDLNLIKQVGRGEYEVQNQ